MWKSLFNSALHIMTIQTCEILIQEACLGITALGEPRDGSGDLQRNGSMWAGSCNPARTRPGLANRVAAERNAPGL